MDHIVPVKVNGKRYYKVSNCFVGDIGIYPSVTTILSHFPSIGLEKWKRNVGEEKAEKISAIAAQRGSSLDDLVQKYMKKQEIDYNLLMPDQKAMLGCMKPFLDNIKEPKIQTSVYSRIHKFAGTLDVYGKYEEIPSIIDIKQHKSDLMFSPEKMRKYFLQVGAYALALEEMVDWIKVNQGVLIFGSPEYGASVHIRDLTESKEKFIELAKKYHEDVLNTKSA